MRQSRDKSGDFRSKSVGRGVRAVSIGQRTQGSKHRSIYNRIDGDDEAITDRDLRPATFIRDIAMKTNEIEEEKQNSRFRDAEEHDE